jgi:Protein of unknown function (DUF3108)
MSANRFVRAGVAALACGAALACAPARADSLQIGYSVRLIGLSLGTAGLSATVDGGTYKVDVSAQLSGIAAAVSRSEGAASATGVVSNGRILAETYATTTSNSKETRTVRMAMNAGSVRAVDIAPPFEDLPGRVPVADAHKRGIVDPLSALVMPATSEGPLIGPNACNRSIPVFDGYTRFDVALRFVGVRDVQARGYSGPVAICSARYRPISGHRPDRPSTKFMIDNREMEVWLMPLEGARALAPFRISVKTMIGSVVIEATNVAIADSGASRAAR